MMNQPLPCLVCGMQPSSAFGDHAPDSKHQPNDAVMFTASGNYGSSVWDPMMGSQLLLVNICDECLVLGKDRIAVMTTIHQPDTREFKPWEPDCDDVA